MAAVSLPPSLYLPSDSRWPLHRDARKIEIDEFVADEPLTNLFLLGLQRMQTVPLKASHEEDWFSFYNIAATHGYPNELWRGVPNTKGDDPTNGFYCNHGSNAFPTWHRLQLHTFEQAVFRHMKDIASEFTDPAYRQAHQDALDRFRLPYWDPCLPRQPAVKDEPIADMWDVPLVVKADTVHVIKPDMKPEEIPNPLLSFKYPDPAHYEESKRTLIDWADTAESADNISKILKPGHAKTLRSPTAEGDSSHDRFIATLRTQHSSLSVNLVQLLHPDSVTGRGWEVFANNQNTGVKADKDATEEQQTIASLQMSSISLESWHDNVHGLVGVGDSTGHMGSLSVAAFDPLFWLHHNNTDRIFALYQALYGHLPDKFIADGSTDPNQAVATTPMSPFVKYQKGNIIHYFDSNDVKDWTGQGFAIPGNKLLTTEAGRTAILVYLREVYSWSTENTVRPKESLGYPRKTGTFYALSGEKFDLKAENEVQFLAIVDNKLVRQTFDTSGKLKKTEPYKEDVNDPLSQLPDGYFKGDAKNGETYTWSVLLNVNKYAFKGTFHIYLFIGKECIPERQSDSDGGNGYLQDHRLAGSSTVFAFTAEGDCASCRHHREATYGDVISITAKLREFLSHSEAPESAWPPKRLRTLESLSPKHVVPFLKENLEWRIVTTEGDVKTRRQVQHANLHLLVADSLYTYPTPDNNVGPLGKYSEWTFHKEVTAGKTGGT